MSNPTENNSVEPASMATLIPSLLSILAMMAMALVLTVGAVILAPQIISDEDLVEQVPRDEHFFDYVILQTKIQMTEGVGSYAVWGIGDSSCLFGFSPNAFEGATDLRAVNLGTFGFVGVEMHVRLLKELLAKSDPPRAVLLWLHPHTLARSSAENRATGYPQWFSDRLDSQGEASMSLLEEANDLYGGTLRLKLLDHAGWGRPQLGEHLNPRQVRERVLETEGWFPAEPMESEKRYGCYELHPDSERALADFGELCRRHELALYLYVMPVLEGDTCGTSYLADMERQIQDALGTGTLVDGVPRQVPWTEMQSPTHFARQAAMRTSEQIGRQVLRSLRSEPEGP